MLITADSVANEVRLRHSQARGVFVICEGDDDIRFYTRMLHPTCEFVFSRGRENLIGALEILNAADKRGIVGIADSDFETSGNVANLIQTGVHDLECVLLKSPALRKVVSELGSKSKIDRIVVSENDLQMLLMSAARPVGVLRRVSFRSDLRLDFNEIRFRAFVDRTSLKTDVHSLVKEVCDNSSNHAVDREWLAGEIETALTTQFNPWADAAGPDAIQILSIALTSALGNQRQYAVEPEMVERALHLAYERAWFIETDLSLRIAEWEESHPGFVVRPPV